MAINRRKEPEEVLEEIVKEEIVQETDIYNVPRNGNQQIRKLKRSYAKVK